MSNFDVDKKPPKQVTIRENRQKYPDDDRKSKLCSVIEGTSLYKMRVEE